MARMMSWKRIHQGLTYNSFANKQLFAKYKNKHNFIQTRAYASESAYSGFRGGSGGQGGNNGPNRAIMIFAALSIYIMNKR